MSILKTILGTVAVKAAEKHLLPEATPAPAPAQQAPTPVSTAVAGESWLQSNWRPLLMVWFSILLGGYWFGFTPETLTPEMAADMFSIVHFGVGGYVVGRSAEKVASTIAPALMKR